MNQKKCGGNKTEKKAFGRFLKDTFAIRPWLTGLSFFLNVAIFSYTAVNAACIRGILNTLERGTSGDKLWNSVGIYLGIMAIGGGLRVAAILSSAYVDNLRTYYYENTLRRNLFRFLFRRRNLKNMADHSGRIFERMDDDVPMAVFPPQIMTEAFGYTGYTLIAVSSLLIVNWKITIFIFIPISIAIFMIQKASARMKENRKENREAQEEVSVFLADTVSSFQTVRTMNARQAVVSRYQLLNRGRKGIAMKDALFQDASGAAVDMAIVAGTAVMMLAAGNLMRKGSFLVGDFALFIFYLNTVADCIFRLFVELYRDMRNGEVAWKRIREFSGEEDCGENKNDIRLMQKDGCPDTWKREKVGEGFGTDEKNGSITAEPAMLRAGLDELKEFRAEGISYQHEGGRGVENVDLILKPGEIVAVTGPVGSGKSTLLHLLAGLIPADSGTIAWNGKKIGAPKEVFRAPDAAFCLQNGHVLNASVMENLTLGYEIPEAECRKALERGCLLDEVLAMPDGFFTGVGENGRKLSGGQKQRLLLSRMLLWDAKLYLLDDAVSALDGGTQKRFWEQFRVRLKETGAGAVVTTDRKEILDFADRIVVLKGDQ